MNLEDIGQEKRVHVRKCSQRVIDLSLATMDTSNFIAMTLSLALTHSMLYNPRRLEAVGYSLSEVLFRQLITGFEDVFLPCSQYPIYTSVKELEPDETVADPLAQGVYVDIALLLPLARVQNADLPLSQILNEAQRNPHPFLHKELYVFDMHIPVLEERKRSPTRHPKDLQHHVESIRASLVAAQSQVITQAQVLFSSPRFSNQNTVNLLATSGPYYRISLLHRDHRLATEVPSSLSIESLIEAHQEDILEDPGLDTGVTLVRMTRNEKEAHRLRAEREAQNIEQTRQDAARKERAATRDERKKLLSGLVGLRQQLSLLVLKAGDPPYSVDSIEQFHAITQMIKKKRGHQVSPEFFEPEPKPGMKLNALAQRRNLDDPGELVFTGVIEVGSPVSEFFF